MMRNGAELVVESLEAHGVSYIFGIPGAKIDKVFDVLADHGPKLVICRHEQNAAFMAQAIGRLTGQAGVCLVTSGPGVTNLVTGLMTANSEGDPVVALGGTVPRSQLLKETHQSLQGVDVMRSVTKYSAEIDEPSVISEIIANAFRIAEAPLPGAAFVSLPQDVLGADTDVACFPRLSAPVLGVAPDVILNEAAAMISKAKCPVLLLGMDASERSAAEAVRVLLRKHPLPVVCTYQGGGIVSRDLLECFVGRVGLFVNQPGDVLLREADLILAIGFQPIEYDPHLWNANPDAYLINIDSCQSTLEQYYQPKLEILGSISENLRSLAEKISKRQYARDIPLVQKLQGALFKGIEQQPTEHEGIVHPLLFIKALSGAIGDDVVVTCDVGSHYIWMARYFLRYQPRKLLFSNGQQTLGVALPWAIAASLLNPQQKIISVSGDGGFLFSAMELETAVRLGSNFVHFVWRDDCYNMVKIQQELKYGRSFGVALGSPDIVAFAESFGAHGLRINNNNEIDTVMKKALDLEGPVIVDVPIDYHDNTSLCINMNVEAYGH